MVISVVDALSLVDRLSDVDTLCPTDEVGPYERFADCVSANPPSDSLVNDCIAFCNIAYFPATLVAMN